MSVPEFVDELPPSAQGAHFSSVYADFLASLRANAGRWAIAPQPNAAAAKAWARHHNLEASTRQGVTYVRAVVSPSP